MSLVSVIIPSYNTAGYAMEAIAAALHSDYSQIEVIVVDDGSTDDTGSVVTAKYGDSVRYAYKVNGGLASARNLGLAMARGEYIVFLDSDDLILPKKIGEQVRILDANRDVTVAYSESAYFPDGHRETRIATGFPLYSGDVYYNLLYGNFIHVNSAMLRRTAISDGTKFDETLSVLEDWDFWLRLSGNGHRFLGVAGVLSLVRLRKGSMTSDTRRMDFASLELLHKLLARTKALPDRNTHSLDIYRSLLSYAAKCQDLKANMQLADESWKASSGELLPSILKCLIRTSFRPLFNTEAAIVQKIAGHWQ